MSERPGETPNEGLPPACLPEEGRGCSICGDEGLTAEVLEVPGPAGRARVRFGGEGGASDERPVAFDLLPDVDPGDRVIVHMGFAIARLRRTTMEE